MRYKRAILSVKVYGGAKMDELERQLGKIDFDIDVDLNKLVENIKKELD